MKFCCCQDICFQRKNHKSSVITLAKDALSGERNIETAMMITFIYQHIVKEFIYHFDAQDSGQLKYFSSNYMKYIERLDGALDAYFRGVFIDESYDSLER